MDFFLSQPPDRFGIGARFIGGTLVVHGQNDVFLFLRQIDNLVWYLWQH